MGRSTVGLLFALAVASASLEVRAEPTLQVTRTEDALDCPDQAELFELASEAKLLTASSASHAYRIAFERTNRVYRAQIEDQSATRTRHLEDVGPQCAPLGRAVALALATMWGTEQEPPEPVVVPPPPAPPPKATAPPPVARATTRWVLSAGAGVALGIVRSATPVVSAESGFEHRPFSLALGGLWVPSQSERLGPGSVDVQLLAASVRGCGWVLETARVGLCARVLAGELLAQSHGYDLDGQQSRPWVALGLEAFVEVALGPHLRTRLGASALAPLWDQSFSIQNVGSGYSPPPLGALLTLALESVSP
jgi:hypothetical protein